MLMLLALVVGLIPLALLGGRLSRLGELGLRATGLLVTALGTQVVITTVETSALLGRLFHVVSYLVVLPFFWLNRRTPGMATIFAGAALNMAAIFANGGVMPATEAAVGRAGIEAYGSFENSAPVEAARLWFLGDVFAVPPPVPLANVFSIGDVVIVAGALVLIYRSCGASLRRRPGTDLAPTATTSIS